MLLFRYVSLFSIDDPFTFLSLILMKLGIFVDLD